MDQTGSCRIRGEPICHFWEALYYLHFILQPQGSTTAVAENSGDTTEHPPAEQSDVEQQEYDDYVNILYAPIK